VAPLTLAPLTSEARSIVRASTFAVRWPDTQERARVHVAETVIVCEESVLD
jgi:hypothetical protein